MSLAAVHNRAVLAALRPMGGKTVSQIAGAANLSTARAEAALHRLAEAGDVRQAANGLWYPS